MLGFCLSSGVIVGWYVFGWLFVVVLMYVGAVVVWVYPVFILCLLWMGGGGRVCVWCCFGVGCVGCVVIVCLCNWGVVVL